MSRLATRKTAFLKGWNRMRMRSLCPECLKMIEGGEEIFMEKVKA